MTVAKDGPFGGGNFKDEIFYYSRDPRPGIFLQLPRGGGVESYKDQFLRQVEGWGFSIGGTGRRGASKECGGKGVVSFVALGGDWE